MSTPTPRRFDRTLTVVAALYCASVAALALVGDRLADTPVVGPELAELPRALSALPLAVLLPFALVRRRVATLISLAAAAALLPFACGITLRRQSDAPAEFRVLTLNLLHGRGGLDRVAAVLRDADADIVCLQETSRAGKSPDPVPYLQAALPEYTFAAGPFLTIASRHPIRDAQPLMCRRVPNRILAQTARIALPQREIVVATAKLEPPGRGATLEDAAGELAEWAEAQDLPTVVAGDTNAPAGTLIHRRLTARLTDAFAAAGSGFGWTYPDRQPLLRVDDILVRGLTPVRCRVLGGHSSDHAPVLAELSFR